MNKVFSFLRESSTARFFIPLGILLIIFGIAMFVINTKNSDYIKTEAVVTKVELIEAEHLDLDGNTVEAINKVYVKYTANGVEYDKELGELSGDYNVGEKFAIYYNPADPSMITQTKSKILPIVITLLGCASLTYGIISAVNSVKRYKKMRAQEEGWVNQ